MQPQREIDKSAHNRLCNVICKAHSSIRSKALHTFAERLLLIEQHKLRHKHKSKSKLFLFLSRLFVSLQKKGEDCFEFKKKL